MNPVHPMRPGSYVLSSRFGLRANPVTGVQEGHLGVDFAAPVGTPFYAVADGVVVEGGERADVDGFGRWVWIDCQTSVGRDLIYGHGDPHVCAGDVVQAGDLVGTVNTHGQSTGPHLHFETWTAPGRLGGRAVDPLPWLAGAAEPEPTGGKAMKPDYVELDRMGESASSRHGARIENFLLHTQEGNGTAESLANYLNNPANGVSYHYTVRDRIVVDVVDTDLASWSVLDANSFTINLCFAGSRVSWSREDWLRIRDDIRIAAWLAVQDARKYGFSTNIIRPPYRRGPGISDHRYVTECLGIGTHTDVGPGFPWDVFAADVASFTSTTLSEEDAMPSADEIASAVWAHRVRKPGAREGHDVAGIDNETAGNMLGWNDLHASTAVDQLGGLGSKDNRDGSVTGFEQLGGRSVVDALAVIGERLGIEGFQDPHAEK
ncbi:peptidoglycan DD-metalloendopeptidase family protein [Nocardia asiatica]|uniref:peptidoglycan DD-metalloendopeptidase family protein n=1 Tax=Nocardia asiatica TaxID=209252 RepID=UPI0024578F56|nr:peptidoglycan DD-metalloendopeptidase family protein [Nocardia asiatica]